MTTKRMAIVTIRMMNLGTLISIVYNRYPDNLVLRVLDGRWPQSLSWTVIRGTGKLTLDDKEVIFRENESTYIPIGTAHRLENPGKLPLSIIEVQNGKYLGEDDIVRLEDAYGRVTAEIEEDA